MRRLSLIVLALIGMVCAETASAQSPYRVEYFLDNDPGYGLAQVITNIHVDANELTFDLSEAESGAHVLYVRAQDTDGKWSTTMSRPLFIDRFQDIVYVEYFFDSDPGVGKGIAIELPDQSYKAHLNLNLQLDITGLALGEHEIFVRARDRFDQWTDVMSRRFTIVQGGITPPDPPQPAGDLSRIEYFFDTDPGYGLGRKLENPRTGKNTYLMDFTGIEHGAHVLYLRAQDTNGYWSTTLSRPLYVFQASGKVVALEYFFDTNDPGDGKATQVQLPGNLNEPFAFDVAIGSLPAGQHQLNVRAKGDDGKWSVVHSEPFRIIGGKDTGIASMECLLPVGMVATKQACTLTSESDVRSDCQVDIVTVGGMRIASGLWKKGMSQFTVPINVSRGTVLIVSVTDAKNNLHVVRRLIAK